MLYNFFFFLRLVLYKLTGKTYPLTVIFNVTDRCNLRCKHCYASYYKRGIDEMSAQQIKDLLKDLKNNGCLRVNFCGGEPLLRKDISELIEYAKNVGLSVDLTSNGVLVPKRIDEIKGIKCLTVSLDGKAEHHDLLRGKGSWQKAIDAIKIARKKGIEVRVNMVLHKFNLEDIDYLITLAKKYGFKIHISLAISNISGEKPLVDIKPTNEQFRNSLRHIIEQKKKGAPVFFSELAYKSVLKWPDFNIEGVINGKRPVGMPTCPAGKMFGLIDADGKLWACPHLIDKTKAENALKVGVAKSWKTAGKHKCVGCYQVYHHDFGHLIDLRLPVLLNYVKSAVGK